MREKQCLDQRIICNHSLSDEAVMVYAALRFGLMKDSYRYFISYKMIEYYLYGKQATRSQHIQIEKGIEDLTNTKFISKIQELGKSDFVYDLSNIDYSIKNYFYVDINSIRKIMSINNNAKVKILRYYFILLSTFKLSRNNKDKTNGKVGIMPLHYLAYKSGLQISTVIKYNKILEDNKIIHIVRAIGIDPDKEQYIKDNVYSKYEDKELCDIFCKNHGVNPDGSIIKKSINTLVSLENRIHLLESGNKYTDEEIAELYDDVLDYNAFLELNGAKKEKYIDIDIFKKYGL